MKQKHFMDIERFKEKFEECFMAGDHIVVQEKIDGANFSICYDEETDSVAAFSRKNPLNFKNNLRGTLETIKIQNPDGSVIDVKKRHDEKMECELKKEMENARINGN